MDLLSRKPYCKASTKHLFFGQETYIYILKEKGSQQQKTRGEVIRCNLLEATRYADTTMDNIGKRDPQSSSDWAIHGQDQRKDTARKRSATDAGIINSIPKDAALNFDHIRT